ncbi:MAG TPA: hypothetical protein VJV79_17595 [Polyangiaceae bacterium]|nr:hypothetical protein [Polyangiaceae bacterium]
MDQAFSRLVTASALVVLAGVISVAACTRTTERVVEPVGGGDASTTNPEVADAGVSPIGPIARPVDSEEDFRLVRAPEFGLARDTQPSVVVDRQGGVGGVNGGGGGGMGGNDQRPVFACGGSSYY